METFSENKEDEAHLPDNEAFRRHVRAPRHAGCLQNADGRAVGIGSCGDSIEVTLRLRGSIIDGIGHCPNGCAYTVACASAMSALAVGKTLDEALQLQPEDVERELGGLPVDHRHCARLAVNTLGEAIADTYRCSRAER